MPKSHRHDIIYWVGEAAYITLLSEPIFYPLPMSIIPFGALHESPTDKQYSMNRVKFCNLDGEALHVHSFRPFSPISKPFKNSPGIRDKALCFITFISVSNRSKRVIWNTEIPPCHHRQQRQTHTGQRYFLLVHRHRHQALPDSPQRLG